MKSTFLCKILNENETELNSILYYDVYTIHYVFINNWCGLFILCCNPCILIDLFEPRLL